MEREAEVGGEPADVPLGQRGPAAVLDGLHDIAGHLFDLAEVVAAAAHLGPQLGVRDACLFAGDHGRVGPAFELPVQGHHVLEDHVRDLGGRPEMRKSEIAVQRILLGALQRDLEPGTAAGRLGIEQRRRLDLQSFGEGVDQSDARLPLSVLEHRQVRGRLADPGAQVIERQSPHPPVVPDAVAEDERIDGLDDHGGDTTRSFLLVL